MPLMRQNGTFSTGVNDEYEEDRQRTACPQEDKASKKGTASKTKWCSLHNTTSHNDAECKAQAVGKSSQDSPSQQTRGKSHNANAATQEKSSEEVSASKDDLVCVMKRISTSLQEQDCNSSRQRVLYGFLIHSRRRPHFISIY